MVTFDEIALNAWRGMVDRYQLSHEAQEQLTQYMNELLAWNERCNLTRITDPVALIHDHFEDSLAVAPFLGVEKAPLIVDVGSGAGFPGLPLKICYPGLRVVLIEVNGKKRAFLQAMIDAFKLKNCEVSSLDWRTFIRKTDYPVSFFLARASLRPDELCRVFVSDCRYHKATVIYWASQHWRAEGAIEPFVQKEEAYVVGGKNRRLIFLTEHGR